MNETIQAYIQLAYGYQIEDETLLNAITKTVGYMQDNYFSQDEILRHLLHVGPYVTTDLFDGLTDIDTLYYNAELVIESKAPVWHPENGSSTAEYYREPKCKFYIEDLLKLYYNKLKVPVELRDEKRDIGAFKHMLSKYKFKKFDTVDYIITLIKIAEENELKTCNVFDIEQYAEQAYEMFNYLVNSNKTKIVWRVR